MKVIIRDLKKSEFMSFMRNGATACPNLQGKNLIIQDKNEISHFLPK